MQETSPPKGARRNARTLDCLILVKDKVLRAMLATCARSLHLRVAATGSVRSAGELLGRDRRHCRLVLLGPSIEDGPVRKVAYSLGRHPRVGHVLAFGIKRPVEGIPGVETRPCPVDIPALVRRLRALAPESPEGRDLDRSRAA